MLTVAVGLSRRIGSVKWVRRGATVESAAFFERRSATPPEPGKFRGLKPTATIMVSLCDCGNNRPAHPVFHARGGTRALRADDATVGFQSRNA